MSLIHHTIDRLEESGVERYQVCLHTRWLSLSSFQGRSSSASLGDLFSKDEREPSFVSKCSLYAFQR